jgi:predicted ArsR family transcriptional regulator
MTQTIQEPASATGDIPAESVSGPTPASKTRHTRLHAQIISYLARHGASRLSDILREVDVCRATLFVHLAILEEEEIIQCDRPKDARRRSTPFYSLRRPAAAPDVRRDSQANLTARIKEAADGKIAVTVDELPGMLVHSRSFEDIPSAVATAARARRDSAAGFTVQVVI